MKPPFDVASVLKLCFHETSMGTDDAEHDCRWARLVGASSTMFAWESIDSKDRENVREFLERDGRKVMKLDTVQ